MRIEIVKQGGLRNLYEKAVPTYASWTVEFISTLGVLKEASKIKFRLGGRRQVLYFEELDEILGITKPGTEGDPWSTQSKYLMLWVR